MSARYSKVSEDQLAEFLARGTGWVHERGALRRTFRFDNFRHAVAFVNRIADAADREDHHPDISIRYNIVELALSTHDLDGAISNRDLELAEIFNTL